VQRADERFVRESAAWRLGRMLNGEHRELVPEWLEIAASIGGILPPHWLPAVLSVLKDHERALARPVLGTTAQWLAQRNPEWAFAVAAEMPALEQWDLGSLPERTAALRMLHVADPSIARSWLERTWKAEAPDARASFVAVLADSPALSGADESFLEAALDDKRKEVRRAAARALRRVGTSALVARGIERLRALLVFESTGTGLLSKLRGPRLQICLPESLSKADLRDGIEQSPPSQQNISERAHWLMQMIAGVPPSHWTERFGCDGTAFLQAVQATDYTIDLLLALAEAAAVHADTAWIGALCTQLAAIDWHELSPALTLRIQQAVRSLISATPNAERPALLRQLMQDTPDERLSLVIEGYLAAGLRWDGTLTRRAFSLLAREVLKTNERSAIAPNYSGWATVADVPTATEILTDLLDRSAANSVWRRSLESLRDTFQFREHMHQELLK
jgi:hypothetical protein